MTARLEIPALSSDESGKDENWAIQIGAFSNYIKARNYALDVQSHIHLPYAQKTEINIEPATKGAAIVYRSQLTGLSKNEADKTCYSLKRANKSCIVVAAPYSDEQQLALADK